ncbi:MAG: FG-GAP-like repeat-containing protein [Bacteroidota bacterium]
MSKIGGIQGTQWTINNLAPGSYTWGVQAIDQDFEGSAFTSQSMILQDPSFEDISTLFGANRTVGMVDPAAVWVDHNQDGRLDLILAGETTSSGNTELFINTVSGFQEVITNLDDVSDATISVVDYNLDNRADVFISGIQGANKTSQLYEGGPGTIDFTKITTGIQGVSGGSSDWADFNLDGLPDLLLTGLDADDQPLTVVYQNLGGGVFNEVSAGLTDIQDGEAKWLDYNNDQLPDIILSGTSDGGGVTELFRGNGDGSFTKIGVAFSTFTRATIGISDIDNDGFVDVVVSGLGEGGANLAIYQNSNGTTFSENAQALTEVVSSSLDLADLDEDGDVDMIVTGQIQGGAPSTILYLNDGNGTFSQDLFNAGTFPNVHRGVIKFADFNSDGKLDLYLAGNESVGSSNFNSYLFQNILPTSDQVPGVPINPSSSQAGNTLNISWEAPANVGTDEKDGIRYNFYLSRNSGFGSNGLFSPLANIGSGAALVPELANTGNRLSRSFPDLTPGTYYWGVQAVDQGMDRSAFTTEQSFTYIPAGASFLDETPTLISGLTSGWRQAEVSMADIDNDDDLDFIISGVNPSGNTEIRVYKFTGSAFVEDDDLSDDLTAVANPSIEWQDVNNDGFLDVLIAGVSSSGPVSILYENENGDAFSQLTTFLGVNASVAWGDYDNDGRSDLLITGQSNAGPVSILYHNDGGGTFSEATNVNLTGVQESSVLWSDINTDGYRDIVLTGNDGSAPITQIYLNNQAGNFTSIGNGGLANIRLGDIEQGDYNNDGLPDFVLAGESGASGFTPVAGVYRNNGDLTFTQIFVPTASREGSVAWGDYNNDGFSDFVIIGKETNANNSYSSRFYTNSGGTGFSEDVANSSVLPDLGDGATVSWGDLNDDDKLDLILSGRSSDVPPQNIFSILTNIDGNANTTLNTPTGLTALQTGTSVEVGWTAPSGVAANLVNGITYNLRIGSSSGDIDILAPLTDATDGFNRIPQSGSLGNTLSWTIEGLSEGQYFWSVQAVDQDFETSPFSAESQFQVLVPDFTDASATVIPGIPANVDLRNGNIYWLDFDNNGELDFIVTGENATTPLITVFENQSGVLNQSSSVATDLIAVTNAELDAADFDKDGDLDVLITGTDGSNSGLTNLYTYDQGQSKFVLETTISNLLQNVTDGDISWGDYDNDGDLDILLVGDAGSPFIRIYENDGLGNFSEDNQGGVLVGVEQARIAWIDIDNDGDLDIVANGSNGTEARAYLYSNNGSGIYTNTSDADVIGTIQGDLAFADIENDGDLDLLISGLNFAQSASSTTLYINDGSGDFANSGQTFMASSNGALAFGDYNEDTFPDLVVTGFNATTDSTVLYDNTNGTFALNAVNSGLFPQIGQGEVSWADYDRDGKLDLAFTGRSGSPTSYTLRIFENNNVNSNTTPDEPENLLVSIINDEITLNWQPPTGATNPDGLSYALYLESVSEGEFIIRPNAFIQGGNSGLRKTVSIGNVGKESSFTISGLPAGDYAWSVQAIDQDFEGSIFAPVQSLTYQPAGLIFFDQSVNALPGNVEGLDQAALSFADVNDDGFLDFVVSGEEDDGDLITEYYEFDSGDNEFDKITVISNELDNVRNGSIDWGDINNDGLPDLIITGDGSAAATLSPQTHLYENNGTGFTEISIGAEDVGNGDAIFGDYNNDGMQDIFVTGSDGSAGVSELFQNVDGNTFVEVPSSIASLTESSADWGDYNNDGFLDLALMGSGNGGPVSFIYRNNGDGTFTGINVVLADVKQGDIKWVDVDNDQDLDLIMCGEQSENGTNPITALYLNEGNENFTLSSSSLTGVRDGNLSLGDINQDTYPDLILSGKFGTGAEDRITEVYLNNGSGVLVKDNVNSQNIQATDNGAYVALGDVLQDRRLDLLVVGRTSTTPETKTFKLYQNITTNALTNPATPTNLMAVQEGNEIVFSWTQAGDTDQSYNLYVGSATNTQDAKSSLSVLNGGNEGYRKVIKIGNVGFASSWRINSLLSGTYEWGVQAIDQDLEGTVFIEGPPITYVAPDFEELQASFIAGGNLPSYSEASMAWGDFDNDEDLDLVISGADGSAVQTRLYRNDLSVNNQFTLLSANLPGAKNGDIEWIDIENDGDLDLIITGESAISAPVTRILVNDGSSGGSFSLIPTPAVPQTINSSIAVGDINNDGAQDFVITGFSQNGRVSEVFLNRGGSFTALNAGLTPIDEGTVALFDADKDGKLDILLSGNSDGIGLTTELYIQTQDLTFRRKVLDLPGLENGSIDWADFDLDGFHDIVLTGVSGPNRIGRVYNFNQADTTYQFFTAIDSVQNGYASWGDFNEDGFTDIILTGQNGNFGTDRTTVLYRNNNGVGFVEEAINSQLFQDLNNGSVATWADINTDGRLDVVMVGTAVGSTTNSFHIYTNQLAGLEADVVPTPINLTAVQDGFDIVISWDPAATVSDETTYELIVGTSSGGQEIRSGLSDPATGFRRVPVPGELTSTFTYRLTDISSPGEIFFGLQAIENDFETSPFEEASITFIRPDFADETSIYFSSVPPLRVEDAGIAWGDVFNQNGSDFLDLFITGATDSVPTAYLYANNGLNNSYTLLTDTLTGVRNASAEWGDLNNDGNLDLLYAGEDVDGNPLTKLYTSVGNSLVDISASAELENVKNGDVYWVDYDNDGDQDIFLTGESATGPTTKLYENLEGNAFRDISLPQSLALRNSSVDWADYDGNGLMDLAIMGERTDGTPFTDVFRNIGNGTFESVSTGLENVSNGDIKWGDFNNDGRVDLAIMGLDESGQPFSAVYRLDLLVFTPITITGLPGLSAGSIEFVDFDNDGYRDLIFSGSTGPGISDRATILLKNNNSGGFFIDNINSSALTDAGNSTIGVVDANLDGKIDLLLTGRADNGNTSFLTTRLFTNLISTNSTVPLSPSNANMTATVDPNDPDKVTLSWTAPAAPSGLDASVVNGYTYNIYLLRDGTLEATPLSDIVAPSNRRVVRSGNTSQNLTWEIDGLPSGTYSWSVQAVDQDYQASVFTQGTDPFVIDAPIFADVTNSAISALPGIGFSESSLDWGDYDNDGDLDLLISGEVTDVVGGVTVSVPTSKLLENLGNGIFDDVTEELGVALIQVRKSIVRWGDFNADGNLDFFISGEQVLSGLTNEINNIYKGDGTGTFTILDNLNIVPVASGDADWGDYDNDGDLDIAVMGSAQSTGANSAIYRNNGDETFNRITIPVNVGSGELAWGDYDGDRDLDLFISGFTGTVPFTRLIDNNNGIFQALEVIPNGLQLGSIDLGDYDNDGDIDLLITGKTTNRSISSVYRNDGTLPFVDIGAPLDSVAEGRGIFGDYNDDGLLDIFLIGSDKDGNRIAKLYQNDSLSGNRFVFDQPASTTLVGADEDAYAAWGDFDGDDKLDLVVTGLEFESTQGVKFRALRFYKNNEESPNGFPAPPTGLTQTLDGNVIQFLWSAPEQYIFPGVDTTDIAGRSFSYNLLLGSVETGEVNIISPMADTANGFRRIVRQGNVGYDFSWEVQGLDAGDYFWSVQAIDTDFEGSDFPEPLQFTFIPTSFIDVTTSEFPVSQLPQRVESAAVNFGDFDNDEDLDILISGRLDNENFATRIYEYDSGYQINQTASDSLVDLRQGAAEWGDYDSDGDLDIFLVGQNEDLEEVAFIYENVNGTFVSRPAVSAGITPVDLAAAKFGDYDNDGDLDLFVAGRDRTTLNIRSDIYENVLNSATDERSFVRNAEASANLVGIENGSVDWGDYNKDSFLDLVIAGEAASGPLAVVYRNTGNRTFVDEQQPLTPIKDGSVSFGDYNNDGFLDILLAGENTSNSFRPASRIFRYDNDVKKFEDIVQGMEDVRNSSVSWADFDNDGYLDFFLLGDRKNSGNEEAPTSSIYRGRPNDDFIQDLGSSQTIADLNFPNGLWGDYNGDGRIDLLLTGVDEDLGNFGFALYRNNVSRAPTIPDQITGLVDDPDGDEVILSWDVPANYVGEFENSPSYNIALGPRGGSIIDVVSPMADTLSGVRSMVRLGNAGHRAQWVLKELPDGFYCWSVQALAENYQGGAFSDTSCFNYINPRPVIEVENLPTLVRYRDETTDTTATITVRDTLVVDRVELNYKGISETSWRKEPASQIPGTNTYAVDIEAGLNRSSIPNFNQLTDREIGIEYYMVVIGSFGTPSFTDTSRLERAYLRFDSLGLEDILIATGREVTAYNIISVPLELDDPSVKATLRDDFGDYDVFNWRFWYYDALGNRQEYDSVASVPLIEPGKGYWLIYSPPRDAQNTDRYNTGAGNTVKAYSDSPFVWTLTPGHNQIGNPYHFDLSWDEIIAYNKIHTPEIAADSLDKLDLNTYDQVYQMDDEFLQRNEGAFVYTSIPMNLKVPVTKNLGIQSERSGSGADFPERYDPIDATNWMVDIRLRKGEIPSWLGAIGMNKTAIFSYDKHDVIAPPRSFGYAEFVSYHPEYENPRFGVDVVPTQESYVWDMVLEQVDAEDPVIMEWDPSYFGNGDKELILYDVERQKPVDMRMINQYVSWSSTVNRQFRIYYGTQAFIDSALSPDAILLGAAYPNPAAEVLNIPFTLPPSLGLYEVKLDMYNTLGQKLFTLFEGRLGEGFHEERVELKHPSGAQLSNGVYLYKLTVKGRDESYEQVKRFVIRK